MGIGTCDGYTKTDEFEEWLEQLGKHVKYGQGCMFVNDLFGLLNCYPWLRGKIEKGFHRGGTPEEACRFLDDVMQAKRRQVFEWCCTVGE